MGIDALGWPGPSGLQNVELTNSERVGQMELRESEKLILMMLAEIHEHLKIKDGIDPVLVKEAIRTGNTWAWLRWLFISFCGQLPDSSAVDLARISGENRRVSTASAPLASTFHAPTW
jgi:hypothetical protein